VAAFCARPAWAYYVWQASYSNQIAAGENQSMLKNATRIVAIVFAIALFTTAASAHGSGSSLRGTVLVAASPLAGSVFAKTVILIVQNNDEGSFGVAVNRPTAMTLAQVLPGKNASARNYTLYAGGPVEPRLLSLLVQASGDRRGLDKLAPDVAFTANALVFGKVIKSKPDAHKVRVIAGYAGWAPGQLEAEIARGDWHIVPAERGIVFSDQPKKLWHRLNERIGGKRKPAGQPL
jgi:putative transcriptional regulator